MANELVLAHSTGATIYALLLNASGQIYNGSTFETPDAANWGDYDIALTEASTTGLYRGTMPSVAAGQYSILYRLQAGGSPATTDTQLDSASVEWSGTEVVTPPGSAYFSLSDLKTYLGISADVDDDLLEDIIGRAQRMVETYCNRIFKAASDTTRYRDAVADVQGRRLWLDYDLCQITTLTNGDGTVLTTDDYVVEPRNGTPWYAITLKQSSVYAWTYSTTPENAISILGRHAYSITPPADIVQGNMRLAAFVYRQKDAQVFDTTAISEGGAIEVAQAIPRDVRALLYPYRRRIIRG